MDAAETFLESDRGMAVVVCVFGLAVMVGMVLLIRWILRRAANQGPRSSYAVTQNQAIYALASRLGLTYIEASSPDQAWGSSFGHAAGVFQGIPVLVCVRLQQDFSYNVCTFTMIEAAMEALLQGVPPMALRRLMPRRWTGDRDALFRRSFALLKGHSSLPDVPPDARDVLLELGQDAEVLMVEPDRIRFVPRRRAVMPGVTSDALERWTRLVAAAASKVGVGPSLEGARLKELLDNMYGSGWIDRYDLVRAGVLPKIY